MNVYMYVFFIFNIFSSLKSKSSLSYIHCIEDAIQIKIIIFVVVVLSRSSNSNSCIKLLCLQSPTGVSTLICQ